jgi:type 1 glutamine amidotransferase
MTTPHSKTLLFSIAAMAVFSLSPAPRAQDAKPVRPIRALLVSGGCCHEYEAQEIILSSGISARAQVEWTLVRDGTERNHKHKVYENPNWADGFDVVVHNECFGMIGDREFIERIVAPHRRGLPAVMIHCSTHSYRALQSDEWRECLGMTSRRHGPQQPLEIKNLQPAHPVMKGFPSVWPTGKEELYVIEKVWPNTVPLARAHDAQEDLDHPVVWTNNFGKARVFGTTLAHNNSTMRDPVFLDLVTRGLLWSCGKLDDQGKPSAGYGPTPAR